MHLVGFSARISTVLISFLITLRGLKDRNTNGAKNLFDLDFRKTSSIYHGQIQGFEREETGGGGGGGEEGRRWGVSKIDQWLVYKEMIPHRREMRLLRNLKIREILCSELSFNFGRACPRSPVEYCNFGVSYPSNHPRQPPTPLPLPLLLDPCKVQ